MPNIKTKKKRERSEARNEKEKRKKETNKDEKQKTRKADKISEPPRRAQKNQLLSAYF